MSKFFRFAGKTNDGVAYYTINIDYIYAICERKKGNYVDPSHNGMYIDLYVNTDANRFPLSTEQRDELFALMDIHHSSAPPHPSSKPAKKWRKR